MSHQQTATPPLVTILTPVYNGAAYLDECIQSVIKQTYQAWEYVIVNNSSTDQTASIVEHYVARDKRISIITNPRVVSVIDNHNIALRMVSRTAKYCKLVSADDWLYPECLSELVAVAEAYSSTGIVGSYATTGDELRWFGVPLNASVVDGREIARQYLREAYTFNAPSALLYRASIVRGMDPFFPGDLPCADTEACLSVLRRWDFGFVHKILSFERSHKGSITSKLKELNSFQLDRMEFLVNYGEYFLGCAEQKAQLDLLLDRYYQYLAAGIVNLKGRGFWQYHRTRLMAMGLPLRRQRLFVAAILRLLDLGLNPGETCRKVVTRCKSSLRQGPAGGG